jgi:hypothetical protein
VQTRSAIGLLYFFGGSCFRLFGPGPNEAVEPHCASPSTQLTHDAGGIGVRLMIRKSILLISTFAMLAVSPLCRAQSQKPSIDSAIEGARADMRADKTTIITTAMNFSDKDAAAFWPVYRQYEYERSTLDDRRVVVIKEYIRKYSSLTDADAKAMAEQMFECDSRLAALKKKYFKKFNKVIPALTVTKFFQLDRRIDLLMDMEVESSLPPLTQPQLAAQDN